MKSWSAISKAVGWEPREVEWPSVKAACKFVQRAVKGDEDAVRELLEIDRFAPVIMADDIEQVQACAVITTGIVEARRAWREIEEGAT